MMNKRFSIHIGSRKAGWDMGFHRHDDYELSTVLDGEGLFETDGGSVPITVGHVLLIPPNVRHRFAAKTSIRFGVLSVREMDAGLEPLFVRLAPENTAHIFFLSTLDMVHYESMFRLFMRLNLEQLIERKPFVQSWLKLFLLFLLQHGGNTDSPISVAAAAAYIQSRLPQEISIGELARLTGLSESYFRVAFKKRYGVSPKQYQQQCRLTEAKWLLQSTDKPLQTISEQVGFATLHAFSSWFKQRVGTSASGWRRAMQSF
jgi:AraC family transcriptional regulator